MLISLLATTTLALAQPTAGFLPPNVLIIVADDLGYGELGSYGGSQIPTPNIDALAKDGVRMTSGYVTSPLCAPSRAGLLTGRHQARFPIDFNPPSAPALGWGLPDGQPTIANRLQSLGYETGAFGKWHLGYDTGKRPLERGFNTYYGFHAGVHNYIPGLSPITPVYRNSREISEDREMTSAIAEEAIRFIRRAQDKPFFAYVAFNGVHTPLQATPESMAPFSNILDINRQTFAGMLSTLDTQVGRIVQYLDSLGLGSNTLVVFVSDNGAATKQTTCSNRPLRGYKGQLWEGGIRVPYVVRWPGGLPAQRYDHAVSTLDIAPTVMAAAGAPADSSSTDGVNLLPYLRGESTGEPHAELYWRFLDRAAIRVGKWKATKPRLYWKLFDLESDMSETTNLATAHPDVLSDLVARWEAWNASMPPRS